MGGNQFSLTTIHLHRIKMQLNSPFTTSFGTFHDKEFFIVEAVDDTGNIGWGESVAFSSPWYNEETVETNLHLLKDFLIPKLFDEPLFHPNEVSERFQAIRKNNMAKASLEGAIWDLYAKRKNIPLYQALGGTKTIIDVGVSLGIESNLSELLEKVTKYVEEGYKRIKLKIKPGWDIDVIREVRRQFPHIQMMADANSAYRLEDAKHLQQLDEFDLTMIEQPLAHDDIIDHAKLQSQIETPICLDESIHSLEDTKKAIELGSCKIINIKVGRVGGLSESIKIHDYCLEQNVPVWCGGMLEAGVGRAHNVALTTLNQFILPGDTAASSHYWKQDIIKPEVTVQNGTISVPQTPGIGYEVDREQLAKYTISKETFINKK